VPTGGARFEIRESDTDGGGGPAAPPPDVAPCAEGVHELLDPANRRYRYPFIACARCGPRFTIIESMPFDRERTVLRAFPLCAACGQEYSDPEDRRFHAQAIGCPECGPRLEWWDAGGETRAIRDDALRMACDRIRDGGIVAMKGVGGFQLMVDATSPAAVRRLRERKARPAKPVAVMFRDLEMARKHCCLTSEEEELLASAEAPIVLVKGRTGLPRDVILAAELASGLPWVGAMLPSSPLHHLILHDLGFPVVATSGNRSEEPICYREAEVLDRLGGVADGFLVHDRPIVRSVDDSVVR
jgi:hydrogenase maturation protein HypF